MNLNRLSEARQAVERAWHANFKPITHTVLLYFIDFLEADSPGMQRELAWAAGRPGLEHFLARFPIGYGGVLRSSPGSLGPLAKSCGSGVSGIAELSFAERRVAHVNRGLIVRIVTARHARAGSAKRAQSLANELAKANPSDTLLNFYWLPTIRAAAELGLNHPAQTIKILQATADYELAQPRAVGCKHSLPGLCARPGLFATRSGQQRRRRVSKVVGSSWLCDEFFVRRAGTIGAGPCLCPRWRQSQGPRRVS
jgi:eukaryotic-like serine/threonine-protein kinase